MHHPISHDLAAIYETHDASDVAEKLRAQWAQYPSVDLVLYCHQAVMELVQWAVEERAVAVLDFIRPHLKQNHQVKLLEYCSAIENVDESCALFERYVQPWMINSSQYNMMGKLIDSNRMDLLKIGKKHMFPEQWDHVVLNLLHIVGKNNNYEAWKILYAPCSDHDVIKHVQQLHKHAQPLMMEVYHDHKSAGISWTPTITSLVFKSVWSGQQELLERMLNEASEHIDFKTLHEWAAHPEKNLGVNTLVSKGAWEQRQPFWNMVLASEQRHILRQETEQAATAADSRRAARM